METTLTHVGVFIAVILGGGVIVTAIMKLLDFLSNFFVTTKQYNQDKEMEQRNHVIEKEDCRKGIFEVLHKKADSCDVNLKFDALVTQMNISNQQILKLVEGQSKVEGKLDTLISLYKDNVK